MRSPEREWRNKLFDKLTGSASREESAERVSEKAEKPSNMFIITNCAYAM